MCMRKKEKIINFRPSDKNKLYLSKLGYIDGRTNYKKSDVLNISEFINQCITDTLESSKRNVSPVASGSELQIAWINFEISRLVRENNSILAQISSLQRERDVLIAKKEDDCLKVLGGFC